jgi:hypothetical protein
MGNKMTAWERFETTTGRRTRVVATNSVPSSHEISAFPRNSCQNIVASPPSEGIKIRKPQTTVSVKGVWQPATDTLSVTVRGKLQDFPAVTTGSNSGTVTAKALVKLPEQTKFATAKTGKTVRFLLRNQ